MLILSHPNLQIVRGFAGAVLFSFPMLMTMEMWSLGVSIEPARLMLFVTVHLILLAGMASFARHDKAIMTTSDARDAFAAYGVGVLASATVLPLFGVVESGMSADAHHPHDYDSGRACGIRGDGGSPRDRRAGSCGWTWPHGFASSAFLMAVGGAARLLF